MRKLLLGAMAALAAWSLPAGPADGQMRGSTATFHGADRGQWRGDRMRWQGQRHWHGDRRWRGGNQWRGDRRWRGDAWGWRGDRRWRGRSHWRDPRFGWGVAWRNPCRGYWWDGWAWRCRW